MRPSEASRLARLRTQMTPSGSSPLTGSSRIRVAGSPRSAAAIPSRCPIPREKPLTLRRATDSSPVRPMTSSTRRRLIPWVAARARRWFTAVRPVCTAFASSSTPTSLRGARWLAYGAPFTIAVPAVGLSRPTMRRIVVDFPAPFGPRNPVTIPGFTENVTLSTALVAP